MDTTHGNGNGKSDKANGSARHATETARQPAKGGAAARQRLTDMMEQVRRQNKQIIDQAQRIEELEAYLACITQLSARVRELELELKTTW